MLLPRCASLPFYLLFGNCVTVLGIDLFSIWIMTMAIISWICFGLSNMVVLTAWQVQEANSNCRKVLRWGDKLFLWNWGMQWGFGWICSWHWAYAKAWMSMSTCCFVAPGYLKINNLLGWKFSFTHSIFTFFLPFLFQRKWKNDAHMAIRDCYNARRIDNSSFQAHYYMSEALSQVIFYYLLQLSIWFILLLSAQAAPADPACPIWCSRLASVH